MPGSFCSLPNAPAAGEVFGSFLGKFEKHIFSEFSEELTLKSEKEGERSLLFCVHEIDD